MNILSDFETGAVTAMIGVFEWPKVAADGAAATPTAETAIGLVGPGPVQIGLGAITIHPAANLTADPTNNATITVFRRPSGGAAVAIGQATTSVAGTGNWTAFTPVTVPLQNGATLSPNDSITVTITKGGTGVIVPQLYLAGFVKIN